MITQKDIELLKDELSKVFVTKDEFRQFKNEIFEKLDKFLAIFTKVDHEQTILSDKVLKHSDTLVSHGKRLDRLEQPHPVVS